MGTQGINGDRAHIKTAPQPLATHQQQRKTETE